MENCQLSKLLTYSLVFSIFVHSASRQTNLAKSRRRAKADWIVLLEDDLPLAGKCTSLKDFFNRLANHITHVRVFYL